MTKKRTMKIDYLDFPKIKPFSIFKDERGFFSPVQLKDSWIQANISQNSPSHVFRGMHYQEGSYAQAKFIRVLRGKIIDFVIDIRPESSRFGEVENFYLDAGNCIEVPRGYAHGFLTLEPETWVEYFVDNVYSPKNEGSIAWNSIEEIESLILEICEEDEKRITITEKDSRAESWDDFKERILTE